MTATTITRFSLDGYDIERFWEKVSFGGWDECWLWAAGCTGEGYGALMLRIGVKVAHQIAYELVIGPVPDHLELDHVCHSIAVLAGTCNGGPTCLHRKCVNPAHMEAVTPMENSRRAVGATDTHFGCGHPREHNANSTKCGAGEQCAFCQHRRRGGKETFQEWHAGRIVRGF